MTASTQKSWTRKCKASPKIYSNCLPSRLRKYPTSRRYVLPLLIELNLFSPLLLRRAWVKSSGELSWVFYIWLLRSDVPLLCARISSSKFLPLTLLTLLSCTIAHRSIRWEKNLRDGHTEQADQVDGTQRCTHVPGKTYLCEWSFLTFCLP